jgi:group II intron reverse transcriptase/maturase
MQKAEQILQAVQKMGEKRTPLTRVYRSLFSEDLFLTAYDKIARNRGALTVGTENDTADGMNLKRIQRIIEDLRHERFKFHPARRIQIPKKSGGTRPLGIPNFTDKLVQEVLRMILEAYYKPRFRDSSHGFRPGRGCHTALTMMRYEFKGAAWFIEGDIRGCFDNIDHEVLIQILARDIQDGRLLNLLRMGLKAGYLEDWQYNRTYSGTPQGGILSPLLANIYLHELDEYIEDTLIPQYTRGRKRASNQEYDRLRKHIATVRKVGNKKLVKQLVSQYRKLPSQNVNDPNYRRLHYVRYADDFILSFVGPKAEAEDVKTAISLFLKEKLHLELSSSKTLITHARTEHAQFLGYDISVYHADHKVTPKGGQRIKTRSVNGCIRLGIPFGKIDELNKEYMSGEKILHDARLLAYSDAQIIDTYQRKFRGMAEYYKFATDRDKLSKLKYVMEVSLTKTLAHKFKTTVSRIYRRYAGKRTVQGNTYKVLAVEVPAKTKTRHIYWGAVPLNVIKPNIEAIDDNATLPNTIFGSRTDLIQRLQANECEICGSQEHCEVHHIRKLSDLKNRWRGRKEKPAWVTSMIALQRKTLVVCKECHVIIHSGKPLPI